MASRAKLRRKQTTIDELSLLKYQALPIEDDAKEYLILVPDYA